MIKSNNKWQDPDDLNNYYNVYFNDYGKLYEQKIIDEKTYKENRFNLF